jgi:hypothetical protein
MLHFFLPRNARKVWRNGSHAKSIGSCVSAKNNWILWIREEINQQDESDAKRYKPEKWLSCDNVGPINLKSFEGYVQ